MTKEKIHSICGEYSIINYTINDDMSIDVNGSVYLAFKNLDKLPLKFYKVTGYFQCSYNNLTSLEGCPVEIGKHFNCSGNKLTLLEGGPQFVGGNFYCGNNPIYEEFKTKFNEDYNLYLKYTKRQKILNSLIND